MADQASYGNKTTSRDYRTQKMLAAVGARVRERRLAADMAQRELARRCGVGPSSILNAEEGYAMPLMLLIDIAEALDTSLDDLVPTEAT